MQFNEKRGRGRPRGQPKSGGRVAGAPNKSTLAREQAIVRTLLAEELTPEQLDELTPLAVMLRVMRAAYQAGDRAGTLAAAEVAAPYCHAKLSSSDVHITGEVTKSDEAIEAERAEILAKMAAAAKDETEPQQRLRVVN